MQEFLSCYMSKKLNVYNQAGEVVEDITLDSELFSISLNPSLVSQVVEAQLANKRQPIAHTKNKAEVAGGGRKPWKQKGTGRARHGSIRSPLWRGGGIIFGPRSDRNFTQKVNKKMKKKALLMSLSDKVANDNLLIVNKLSLEEGKTKKIIEILNNLLKDKKLVKKVLIIYDGKNPNLIKSVKNLTKIQALAANSLNIVDLLNFNNVILTKDSLKIIKELYSL